MMLMMLLSCNRGGHFCNIFGAKKASNLGKNLSVGTIMELQNLATSVYAKFQSAAGKYELGI